MLNEMIIITVTKFSGTDTPDKNGEEAVMLQCIAGTMPNRNVMSGTVAKRGGFEVGKSYLVNVREAGIDDTFGQDFDFVKVKEVDALEAIKGRQLLGEPKILTIARPEGFEKVYQRKSNAIEGQRTIREKEGKYHRVLPSSTLSHETAPTVEEGSSVHSGGKLKTGA